MQGQSQYKAAGWRPAHSRSLPLNNEEVVIGLTFLCTVPISSAEKLLRTYLINEVLTTRSIKLARFRRRQFCTDAIDDYDDERAIIHIEPIRAADEFISPSRTNGLSRSVADQVGRNVAMVLFMIPPSKSIVNGSDLQLSVSTDLSAMLDARAATPGRGDFWILKIAHAPSPKNLSKNGFCPERG